MKKHRYVIMWVYQDQIGRMSGAMEVLATSRDSAKKDFFKNNRKLVLRVEHGNPIINPKGGYTCEAVLTYREWLDEGKPDSI